MLTKDLKDLLTGLDLIDNQAIYFFNKEDGNTFSFPSKEIEKKLQIIKPTAFYLFNNQPYILFFDLTTDTNTVRENEIHKQVWSFDQSPLIFIIKPGDIQIFNAFAYDKKQKSLQRIDVTEKERNEQFSFWNLQSGITWQWLQTEYYENKKHKDTQKRVYQRLFDNIKEVRKTLIDNGLKEEDANILILRIIFIRYLIDRNISIDKTYISSSDNLDKRKSFLDLLQSEERLTEFFKYLNGRFNGVLFKDVDIKLSVNNLEFLANIFDIRSDKITPTLFDKFYFDVFDFSIIPVEVISGIYESLMDEETRELNSAVYTPSFLVDYILNDTLDNFLEENNTSECKIFDPSCGSGIFLVQSLRRLIDKEIELFNSEIKTKKFSERIREIAKNNLFGVDINPEALKVTCFSIYIALLDYQEPKDIDKYEFPNLIGENLFDANFFDTNHPFNVLIKKEQIDFILGNPPWKNASDDVLHKKYLKDNNLLKIISDYQLAQSFTIRTKDFSNERTKCCLIITSKAIYNIHAEGFRQYFLENFYLTKCFDLSPVRWLIFEGKGNPAMVLQFQYSHQKNTLDNIVLHQSLKYSLYLKYFKALVIEKSDTKKIKQQFFYDNYWMFKVALYGGILDYTLIKKLFSFDDSIISYVKNVDDIYFGDGIKKYTKNGLKKLKKQVAPFYEIENLPIIETNEIKSHYIAVRKDNLPKPEDLLVKSGKSLELYEGDKILFSQNLIKETEIIVPYSKGNSVYREKTLGITSKTRKDILKEIFLICSSNLYTYYQYLTSSNWGIYYAVLLQKEYTSFPFYELNQNVKAKMLILADEVIKAFEEYHAQLLKQESFTISNKILVEINEIINSVYGINTYEKDLIDYTLNIARYQFQSEEKQKITTDFTYSDKTHYRNREFVLREYADVFLEELKKIYKDEYLQVQIYSIKYFIAMNFTFLSKAPQETILIIPNEENSNEKEIFGAIAKSISLSQIAKDLFIQKDIKGFEENSFYIIKPHEYKCWHKAMAWYDLAEIKEAIQSAELERLKHN